MSRDDLDWAAIALTPLEAGDVAQVNAWQNEPEIRDVIMGFRGPVRLETTAEWIESLGAQNLKTRAVFALRVAGALAGVVQLHTIDWIQRTAMLGIFVGEQADRRAGAGWAASVLVLDYAFAALDLHRVALEVISSNAPARRLYERLGFTHEGALRSAFMRAGRREDIELYGLLKSEWAHAPPPEAHRLTWTA